MFPLTQILFNSLLFTCAFALVVWGSLWWNPRIWLQDFPKPMRDALPPHTAYEKNQLRLMFVLLMVVVIVLPIVLNAQLQATMGAAFTFPIAYLHTCLMLQAANLYDAIGIDLVITVKPPKFTHVAGTEPYMYLLWNKDMHIRNFIKGLVGMSVWALILALIAIL